MGQIKISVAALEQKDERAPVLFWGRFEESLCQAKEMGYDAMEIHVRDPREYDSKKLGDISAKLGMKISGIATGLSNAVDGLSLIAEDDAARMAAVERLCAFVDMARDLGAAVLVGRMKDRITDFDRQSYFESLFADSMLRVGAYASKRSTLIMLEAINRYESNYCYTIDSIASLIRKNEIPATRILMDAFHMNIEEANCAEAVQNHRDLLGYVHFADSNRHYPGDGHTDLKTIYRALCQIGYTGYIGVECLPIPDAYTAAQNALRYMRRLERCV